MPQILQGKQHFFEEVVPQIIKENGYKSPMRVPRIEKIVVNIGLGEAIQNPKAIEAATADLATITGQKPVVLKASKSIASFKLRQGMSIGAKVTLRGQRMYDFFSKLVNVALPRIKDFHGIPRESFDGRGNYALGIKEQIIFPEINYDKIDRIRGLQVNIITTARTDEEGRQLLEMMGMPFTREN